MFHLLLYVTEIVKQSHAVRDGRFRIEFQPGQGNLTHTYGNQVTHTTFPLSSPVHRHRVLSPTTEYADSAPVCRDKNKSYFYKEGLPTFHVLVDQVFKLTDYHISWHVASTFKSITK